jgi:hypothetical protein
MKKILVLLFVFSLKLHGQSAKIEAVSNENNTPGIRGIIGFSAYGTTTAALEGINNSLAGYGVKGQAEETAIFGNSVGYSGFSNIGVLGNAVGSNGAGVKGVALGTATYGLYGIGPIGVYGNSPNIAGSFESENGYSLQTYGKLKFGGNGVGTIAANKFMKSTNSNGDVEWSDLFPYDLIKNSSSELLSIQNQSLSAVTTFICGTNTSSLGSAIKGIANNTSPTNLSIGLWGVNMSTNAKGAGIYGYHAGSGIAILGYSEAGSGASFSCGLPAGNALITETGKVGIGNNIPNLNSDERMEINGRLRIRDSTSTAGIWFNNTSNSKLLTDGAFVGLKNNTESGFWIGNAWRFWVNNLGNATLTGTLTQSSDKRLKKEIFPLTNSLSNVLKLNGYQYKWKEEIRSKEVQTGLIAQEVQKIFPELVQTDEKGFLLVNYIGLVPHLIEAVKELQDENNSLKNKNQTLESRLDKIEALLVNIQPITEKSNAQK